MFCGIETVALVALPTQSTSARFATLSREQDPVQAFDHLVGDKVVVGQDHTTITRRT